MIKCLDDFFKMLFSKKESNEPIIETPIKIENEEVLETPIVIEPKYPNVKILKTDRQRYIFDIKDEITYETIIDDSIFIKLNLD